MRKFFYIVFFLLSLNCVAQRDSAAQVSVKTSEIDPEVLRSRQQYLTDQLLSDPENEKLYFERGTIYLMLKVYQNAILDYDKVITLNKTNVADAYYFKALTKINLKITDCESLESAQKLGYSAEWQNLKLLCPNLK